MRVRTGASRRTGIFRWRRVDRGARRNGRVHWLPLTETARATDGDPVQQALAHSTQEGVRGALAHLTEEQRQVVVLKFVEGRSNAEVAALLGKNEGAIKALQHRALAALRRLLSTEVAHESA